MDNHRDFEQLKLILAGDPDDVSSDLGSWLAKIPNEERNLEESRNLLIMRIPRHVFFDGFVDLFYQAWTLEKYQIVIAYLAELGCMQEKEWLEEAFDIYVGGNQEISEAAYSDIDWSEDSPRWERFDAIGNEFDRGLDAVAAAFQHFKLVAPDVYKQPSLKDL
jgi:hypothetical protein